MPKRGRRRKKNRTHKVEITILHIKMPSTHLFLNERRKIRIGIESQLMIGDQLQGHYGYVGINGSHVIYIQ